MKQESLPTVKAQDIFIPVSVETELPDGDGWYHCIFLSGLQEFLWFNDKKWHHPKHGGEQNGVTHWLKQLPSQYIFSKEELLKFISDSMYRFDEEYYYTPGMKLLEERKEFIKTILP